jgi:hypothetical protein
MAWTQSVLAVVDDDEVDPDDPDDPDDSADPDFAGGVLASLLVLVPSPDDESDEPSPPSPPDAVAEAGLARRSFLAQPDPLKWTAGAANALRTGPEPQSGQTAGGSSCRPWIVSNRRPHAAQS